MFSPLFLLSSFIVGIVTSSSSSLSTYQSLQQQYYELLASYEDDDFNSPPGPTNGWPHTQPYTTTHNDLVSYNKLLEQRMYITYQQEYFAGKSTFVFVLSYVISGVQLRSRLIWVLRLNLVCLYMIAFANTCTNICQLYK